MCVYVPRNVVVNNRPNVRNVQTASSNIGGDENVDFLFFEIRNNFVSVNLIHVAVQKSNRKFPRL